MERGYVKLWRKSQDSGLMQNAHALQLFCYLLLSAVHKERKFSTNGVIVTLNAGDAIFSRIAISQRLKMSEKNARTALEFLKKLEIVTTKATNRFTIVSFVNWATYQQEGPTDGPTDSPAIGQQVANSRPTSGHCLKNERMKECKNNINTGTECAKSKKFVKPTVEEVEAYCKERNNGISGQAFIDHYEAVGWVHSRGKPVVDWKACVRTWEHNRQNNGYQSRQVQYQPSRPKAWDVQNG